MSMETSNDNSKSKDENENSNETTGTSLTGHKRKLSDSDSVSKDDLPPKKQQKMTENEDMLDDFKSQNENKKNENSKNENKKETRNKTKFEKLKDQIEFYFSNSNLPLDTFILTEISENDGWFPISKLLTFKRVSQLSNDETLVKQAIIASDKLILNKDETMCQRSEKMGKLITKEEIFERSIFAKGFHPRMSIDHLLKFWKKRGKVNSVRPIINNVTIGMFNKDDNSKDRKTGRRFMGDCFVEFESVEERNKFVNVTFDFKGRIIKTGARNEYTEDVNLVCKEFVFPFECDKVLYVSNLSPFCTFKDVKEWANDDTIKCAFIRKERNESVGYIRLKEGKHSCNASDAANKLSRRPLMTVQPKVYVMKDEEARKVWDKLASTLTTNGKVEKIDKNKNKKLPATIEKHVNQYKSNQKYFKNLHERRKNKSNKWNESNKSKKENKSKEKMGNDNNDNTEEQQDIDIET